jgi:hypothetical protein
MISIPRFETKNQAKAHAIRYLRRKDMHHKFKWIGAEGYSVQNPGTGGMDHMSKLTNEYSANDYAGYVKEWEKKGWIKWLP